MMTGRSKKCKEVKCKVIVGLLCIIMLTGCAGNSATSGEEIQQGQTTSVGDTASGQINTDGESVDGQNDLAGQNSADSESAEPVVPTKTWESEEDFYIVDSYVMPDALKSSRYDMENALTCIPLKEAFAPYFKFGMAMSGYNAATFAVESPEMQELLKYHCNTTTATNLMKPSYTLMQKECQEAAAKGIEDPVLDFSVTDKMLAFCQSAGIGVRGHTLVWHAQTPDWFFREGYTDDGAYVDADTLKYRMESYIRQMMEFCQDNYPGVVYCWDVVNECVEVADGETESGWHCRTSGNSPAGTNQWYDILGYEYVELAFTYARKYAAEDVALVYNDYNTWDSLKAINICKLMEYLKDKGLVDALGMQCNLSVNTDLLEVHNSIVKYAKLGLELQVTELNIVAKDTSPESYAIQAEAYETFMQYMLLLDNSNGGKADISVVNVFSLMDGYLMYDKDDNNYCIFDCNIQPKPCYYSMLRSAVKYGKNNPEVLK